MDEETEIVHLSQLENTFDQSIIIAKLSDHLKKLSKNKNFHVWKLKWDPPIENEGITTITKIK